MSIEQNSPLIEKINKDKINETDIYEAFNLFDKIGKNSIEIDDIPDVIHALGLKMDIDEIELLVDNYAENDPEFDYD